MVIPFLVIKDNSAKIYKSDIYQNRKNFTFTDIALNLDSSSSLSFELYDWDSIGNNDILGKSLKTILTGEIKEQFNRVDNSPDRRLAIPNSSSTMKICLKPPEQKNIINVNRPLFNEVYFGALVKAQQGGYFGLVKYREKLTKGVFKDATTAVQDVATKKMKWIKMRLLVSRTAILLVDQLSNELSWVGL